LYRAAFVSAGISKQAALIGAAALLVVFILGVALFRGFGGADVPDGAIAAVEDVDDGTVTQEMFDSALAQAAASAGQQEPPKEDDPLYDQFREAAMQDALLGVWLAGEAEERGVDVSERELGERLEQIIEQNFGGQKAFDQFKKQSGLSEEDVTERVRLTIVQERVLEEETPQPDEGGNLPVEVSDSRVEAFYEQNAAQFERPETRDVRVVLNKDEDKAAAALAELEADDSGSSWKQVAKQYSTDDASKNNGGLLRGIVEGQGGDAAFDQQVFGAAEDELDGPFETDSGFYVIQVTGITESETTPLSEASDQIRQQLASQTAAEIQDRFASGFVAKWTERTTCAEDFVTDRCRNFEPEVTLAEGQAAAAPFARPVGPGTAGSVGFGAGTGLPQGPLQPEAAAAAPGGGLVPGGLPGGVPAP
jgi:foldase protein PrsA